MLTTAVRCSYGNGSLNRRSVSIIEARDLTIQKLQSELKAVEVELQLKGIEQEKLERVRDQLELEIDELTANLFEVII